MELCCQDVGRAGESLKDDLNKPNQTVPTQEKIHAVPSSLQTFYLVASSKRHLLVLFLHAYG